jgi:hypothetical protein
MNNSPAIAGKNMNYFLMDGIPNGRVKCTLSNWTGVAYRIPRVRLVDCKNIDYLKQSGIYLLFCKGDNDEPLAYIGQAGERKNGEGILHRLGEHHANPKPGLEDWYEAIAFTATNDNWMSATEISWLENNFYCLAKTAGRYELKNGNEPNKPPVIEEKESELMEFSAFARIITGVLGHPIFESLSAKQTPMPTDAGLTASVIANFEIKQGEVVAYGQRTNEGFVVFKDSKVKTNIKESCPKNAKRQRELHAEKIANGILKEDILLRSPNEAACFVTGNAISGITAWKTPDGKTLKEIEASEAEEL